MLGPAAQLHAERGTEGVMVLGAKNHKVGPRASPKPLHTIGQGGLDAALIKFGSYIFLMVWIPTTSTIAHMDLFSWSEPYGFDLP